MPGGSDRKSKDLCSLQSPRKDQLVDAFLRAIYTAPTLGKPCMCPLLSDDQRARGHSKSGSRVVTTSVLAEPGCWRS